jgi:hypothetical protein
MSRKFATALTYRVSAEADPTGAIMGVDRIERMRRQEEDERLFRAIKGGDWRTALMELFKEARQVHICKHGNITNYQPCPQCDAEIDEWTRTPDDDE